VSRRLVSAAAAALLGALFGIAWLALFCVTSPALSIDFAVDPPRLVSGVYPAEYDVATGLTFAWTRREMALRLPGLDRRVGWSVEIRLRGARANAADNPQLYFFVDGVRVDDHQSQTDFTTVKLALPPRPERRRGALIAMQASTTLTPGPQDPRTLGVMLDFITLRPDGIALPPAEAMTGAALSGAALGGAIGLLGVTPGLAIAAAVLLAAAQAVVIGRGLARLMDLSDRSARLATVIGACLVLIATATEQIRRQPLRNTARFAAAFTAGALFLKLLVFLHPAMPIGDAMFQAHRFQAVLGGSYYFTSIAPGDYLFPYAPGLYVTASPFAGLVRGEEGNMILLRVVVLAADAAVAILLYAVVARSWGDRRAAAFATALYQLIPLDFQIAAGGTLTNAFAQSLAVGVLAITAAPWVRLERPLSIVVLVAAFLAAFLSHTSTFAILSVTAVIVAIVFAARGGPVLRSPALAVAIAGGLAVLLAVVVYYAHFIETYRTEFARIGKETATAAADAGGRSISYRAAMVPHYLRLYFGVPSLVLMALGTFHLWRRGARDRLSLTVGAWALTCTLFLVVGVLTPVDMRYYVAALPAVAIASAAAASNWWEAGGARRAAATVLLAWAAWIGVGTWVGTLR
jgi:hypothetical protein